jgi:SAM-dependent methyltransferase
VATDSQADAGFRDLDSSAFFNEMVATLDHFNESSYITATRRAIYRLVRPKPGAKVLDVGCSVGKDVAAIAQKVSPGGFVLGLDVSERMIRVARERHRQVHGTEFVTGSVEGIPFHGAAFDSTFAMRTLQYLSDPSIAVRELACHSTGRSSCAGEGGLSMADLPASLLTREIFGPKTRSLGLSMRRLLKEAGLEKVQVRPAFGIEKGAIDAMVLEYARGSAATAVERGMASESEAEKWLACLESISEADAWFSIDCILVVFGTVPRPKKPSSERSYHST